MSERATKNLEAVSAMWSANLDEMVTLFQRERRIKRLRRLGWTLKGLARLHGMALADVASICGERLPRVFKLNRTQVSVRGGVP